MCEAAPRTDRTSSNAHFHPPVSSAIDVENLIARLTFRAIGDLFEVSATRAIAHRPPEGVVEGEGEGGEERGSESESIISVHDVNLI